ncbi:LysE family translocator [Enterovibrio nigricans]|uniref:Threonine/homoserine/homoserine lactone efflux protein n=1 Tax=Enterovibrio nigricans DSM 22720 TaxID=1121868 RepID=A0A1T4UDQ7_9GAMM|nr:LysE family translocator [Enterovibrio nigricans]SKA50885.1 Threonine/homoserine/homoserine lactone efflux protein [Enterovibrio nigricans DSM 22720]
MVSMEFLITSLVVVLIPGTGVLYTISTGLFVGYRASIWASIGCTVGIIPSMLASITGLAILIHTSAIAFQFVKYLGVAYLLFMAWSMWKNSGTLSVRQEKEQTNMLSIAVRACLINVLNPKLTLFFMAFLPQFVPSSMTNPTPMMLLLGCIFMAMTFIVFIGYGLLSATVRDYVLNSSRITTLLQRVFAGSFALLGLKLAFSERH